MDGVARAGALQLGVDVAPVTAGGELELECHDAKRERCQDHHEDEKHRQVDLRPVAAEPPRDRVLGRPAQSDDQGPDDEVRQGPPEQQEKAIREHEPEDPETGSEERGSVPAFLSKDGPTSTPGGADISSSENSEQSLITRRRIIGALGVGIGGSWLMSVGGDTDEGTSAATGSGSEADESSSKTTESASGTESKTTESVSGNNAVFDARVPEGIVIIGYPNTGITVFSEYYRQAERSHPILIPDGLRDGALPGEVGNQMKNVIGTAPAAGGPNLATFNSLFEQEYGTAPGVFTAQSFDSATIGILANAAAGENDGSSIRDQMRRIANPTGMEVGPQNFIEGVEAAANGQDITYRGASSITNFDQYGDPSSAAYEIWKFGGIDSQSTAAIETKSFSGAHPEGNGSSADDGLGGTDREISIGILFPQSGALDRIGQALVEAARIPSLLVNDANPAGLSVDVHLEDTETSPQTGVDAGNRLVSAGVPFICGPATSGVNIPFSQEVAIPNEVVGCSPSSTALSVTNLMDNDFIFRTAPSDRLQGRAMAQVMSERLGSDTVSTVYVDNNYGAQLSNRFSSVFEDSFDGEVLTQVPYNLDEPSYSSVIETALSGDS